MKARQSPPSVFLRFFRWFVREDLQRYIEGDLMELYQERQKQNGTAKADIRFAIDVILLFRPGIIRPIRKYKLSNTTIMYRSYFTTAFRNMVKNKLHAFINIAGLTVGMAVAIVISLWINDELAYESNFENRDRIAMVVQNVTNNGQVETWFSTPYPLAEALRKNYGSNFTHVVLTSGLNDYLLSVGDKNFTRTGVFAETDFAELFSLKMIHGRRDVLKDQSSILLSESTAKAFFGDANPVGQVMTVGEKMTVHVGGVYQDIPEQSELKDLSFVGAWDFLYNQTEWIKTMRDPWRPNAFTNYVGLADNVSFDQASTSIRDAKLKNVSKELAKKKPELFLFPMNRWHLYSDYKNGKHAGGRIQYVWLFGVVGVFVVLMACINFMNLSTARSERRAKEVGIRKAIGSYRGQLISQFFIESILISLLSLVAAVGVVQLSLPLFNSLSEKHMSLPWSDLNSWMFVIAFSVMIGMVAGSYPALYLSSIKPSKVLKGVFKASKSASLSRKILVVVQFTVSVVLIIGTAIVFKQIQFAKNRPIGYETDGLISIPFASDEMRNHLDALRDELINSGAAKEVSFAEAPTTELWSSSSVFDWDGKDPDLSVDFNVLGIAHEYGKTIGWDVKDGRDFSREFITDTSAMILNESAAKYLGFKNVIGEVVRWYKKPFKIIGVVADIVSRSPYQPVKPMFYFITNESNFAIVKIDPKLSATEAIQTMEGTFKKYAPAKPFNYQFTDESYARKFGNEERVGRLAGVFSSLAIFISCLGIFGLSSFIAEQRTKEIGVRKVLGATVFELWQMMSKDFVVLVILSCIIATPIAYQVLGSWLESYEYRVAIPLWICIAASVGTLMITLITISWHTFHAASINPGRSLRTE